MQFSPARVQHDWKVNFSILSCIWLLIAHKQHTTTTEHYSQCESGCSPVLLEFLSVLVWFHSFPHTFFFASFSVFLYCFFLLFILSSDSLWVCFKFSLALWLTSPYFYIYKLHGNVLTCSLIYISHKHILARARSLMPRKNEAINLNTNLHTTLLSLSKQQTAREYRPHWKLRAC